MPRIQSVIAIDWAYGISDVGDYGYCSDDQGEQYYSANFELKALTLKLEAIQLPFLYIWG